jgi:REP element-mobilizing transposase RayT
MRGTNGVPVWQRNYYEHVIRNHEDWDRIHRYIESNPSMWAEDEENPTRQNNKRA